MFLTKEELTSHMFIEVMNAISDTQAAMQARPDIFNSPEYTGTWDVMQVYELGNIVDYNGQFWESLTDNNTQQPDTRAENWEALTRDEKIDDSINAAITEAANYMSRYDIDYLFEQEGPARDPILLMYVKDIAKWHYINLGNPGIDYESAKDRYLMAIKWLSKIQSGFAIPKGWPKASPDEISTFFHVKSARKRVTQY